MYYRQLAMLLDLIYIGEVNVMQEDLEAFLMAAIDIKIQGLTPCSPLHPPEDMQHGQYLIQERTARGRWATSARSRRETLRTTSLGGKKRDVEKE